MKASAKCWSPESLNCKT